MLKLFVTPVRNMVDCDRIRTGFEQGVRQMAEYLDIGDLAGIIATLVIERAKKENFTLTAKDPDNAELELEDLIGEWIDSNMTQYDE